MSTLSNGEFQNLDICGNLTTQNLISANGASLGSGSSSFNYIQGSLYATGDSQFTQGATYAGDTVFQQRVTASDLTLSNNFIAQSDATYQGNMQTEANFNAIGKNVNIGRNTSNETRLFVRSVEPVLMDADMDICGNAITQRLDVIKDQTIGGDLHLSGRLFINGVQITSLESSSEPETYPEIPTTYYNNLVITNTTGSNMETVNYIVNTLSWNFASSDITSGIHENLLSTVYSKDQGNLNFYENTYNTSVINVPNSNFFSTYPSLEETTYLSQGKTDNAAVSMEDGSAVPYTLDLNNVSGLVLFRFGVPLTPDTNIQFAQLTLSNDSNGIIEVKYGSPVNTYIYQIHKLLVTNGVITNIITPEPEPETEPEP